MIPQSFKDIISNGNNTGLFQTLAMIVFIMLFLGLVIYVFTRPKKYYHTEENAPLEMDNENSQNNI